MDKQSINNKYAYMAAAVFFMLYFAIGLLVVRDYGISYDETIQREHSLISYKYVKEKILQKEIKDGYLGFFRDLEGYEFKYYGVALQMPLVLIEDVLGFSMSSRQIFLIRHIYNFLICFLGYVCFYFALKKILKNNWLALLGIMLLALYPRFYGNQFFDIKNMLFAGMSMITFWTLVNVVEYYCVRNALFFGVAAALSANVRFMGIYFLMLLLAYFLLVDITDYVRCRVDKKQVLQEPKKYLKYMKKYLLVGGCYFLSWIIVTPVAWENPIKAFWLIATKMSHWTSGSMLFNGQVITSAELPWHYLFVWFGITIPLTYQILFVLGHIYVIEGLIQSQNKWMDMLDKYKWPICIIALFWGNVGVVIILKAWIYIEWRHMYFVFVPFCGIVVYGIQFLIEFISKKLIYSFVAMCLLMQVFWSVRNHPYQYVYFNMIGKQVAANFDRDSWRVANYDMVKWILEHEETACISGLNGAAWYIFTDEERERIYDGMNEESGYIIENYRNVAGNRVKYEGYEEVHSIWVDDFKIGSVFRRIDAD